MTAPAELELEHLPIGEQVFADNPNRFMLAARARHPWLARSDFGLIVTDYDACNDILAMDAKLKTPFLQAPLVAGFPKPVWSKEDRSYQRLLDLDTPSAGDRDGCKEV